MATVVLSLLVAAGRINSIQIEGVTLFTLNEMREALKLKEGESFHISLLKAGLERLKLEYREKGHYSMDADYEVVRSAEGVDIFLYIFEGRRSQIVDIEILGAASLSPQQYTEWLGPVLPPNLPAPYDRDMLQRLQTRLYQLYSESGYPFITVELKEVREVEGDRVRVYIEVDEGKRVFIEDVQIENRSKVSSKLIMQKVVVTPGEWFTLSRVVETERRIYSTGLFTSVNFRVEPGKEDSSAVLVFTVIGGKPLFVDIGGGFSISSDLFFRGGSDTTGGRRPFELKPRLGVGHLNLFGLGQRLEATGRVNYDFSGFRKRELELSHTEPRFLGFNLEARLSLNYFYEQGNKEDITVSYRLDKELTQNLLFAPGLNAARLTPFAQPALGQTGNAVTNINSFTQEVRYDGRDNIFNPVAGVFSRLLLEESGGVLQGEADLIKPFVEGSVYHRLAGGYIGAARLRLGRVFPYGRTESVPYTENFLMGGEGSVRGFPRASVGLEDIRAGNTEINRSGKILLNYNFELRKRLAGAWGFALFFDGGGLWNGTVGISPDDLVGGVGVGLHYYTAVGPIRLETAWRLPWGLAQPVEETGSWQLNLGLGHMI